MGTHDTLQLLQEAIELSREEILGATEALAVVYESQGSEGFLDTIEQDFSREVEGSLASQIQRQAIAARTMVDQMSTIIERQQAQTESIERVVHLLREVGTSMGKLSARSHILSLNMAVETARLGKGSGAMNTIAKEMQHHSQQTSEAVERVFGFTDDLQGLLIGITQQAEQLVQLGEGAGQEVFESVVASERSLKATHERVKLSAAGSRERADRLEESAYKALGHLQFQDRMEQLLDRAKGQLSNTPSLSELTHQAFGLTRPSDTPTPQREPDG